MDRSRRRPAWILCALALPAFSNSALQTAVAPALPRIQHDLGVSTASVSWVLTVTLLSAAVSVPIAGRLADMFGKRRALLAVAAIVAVGCLVAAVSTSLAPLLVGRALQGVGSAIFPIAFGVIRDEFSPARRATAVGLLSAIWGPAAALAFPLSGVVVDVASYHWIFWIGLILTLVAVAATAAVVPESPSAPPARIDWVGALLLSGGLGTFLLAISQTVRWGWAAPRTLALLAVGVAILGAWIPWELRTPAPLADLRLLRQRRVWSVNLPPTVLGYAMFSQFLLIPEFVEVPRSAGYGFGASVTEAGLYLMPIALMMLLVSPISGFLAARSALAPGLIAGTVCATTGFALLVLLHDRPWGIVVATSCTGLGAGLTFATGINLLSAAVPREQIAEANAMNVTLRTIASSTGATIAATILARSARHAGGFPTDRAFTTTFALQAAAAAAAIAPALLLLRLHRRDRTRLDLEAVALAEVASTTGT